VRFEHCHRLDRDAEIVSAHREFCWKEWIAAYSYNQTRDRVEYAKRRLRVLRGEPPPGAKRAAAPVPVETSEKTEKTMGPVEEAPIEPSEASEATELAATLPGAQCAEACEKTLLSCKENCQTAPRGCVPCEPEYRTCMQRCFK
jgi:hypothetical protein